jgi:DnaJ like chaperone protein
MDNHPDRVAHLGEEFRKLAEERMRKINAAYETLKEAGLAN